MHQSKIHKPFMKRMLFIDYKTNSLIYEAKYLSIQQRVIASVLDIECDMSWILMT